MSIHLAYGVPGSGKTTLLVRMVQLMAREQRFLITDITGEWGPDSPMWLGEPPVIEIFDGSEEEEPDGSDLPDVGVFVYRGYDGLAVAEMAARLGDSTFVSDELDILARRAGWEDSPLRRIIHRGRHLENEEGAFTQVHLLGACRRPQNLHTDVTDLADQVFVFRCQGARTLMRLEADSMLSEGSQWETVRALPDFHFLHWPSGMYFEMPPITNGKNNEKEAKEKINVETRQQSVA